MGNESKTIGQINVIREATTKRISCSLFIQTPSSCKSDKHRSMHRRETLEYILVWYNQNYILLICHAPYSIKTVFRKRQYFTFDNVLSGWNSFRLCISGSGCQTWRIKRTSIGKGSLILRPAVRSIHSCIKNRECIIQQIKISNLLRLWRNCLFDNIYLHFSRRDWNSGCRIIILPSVHRRWRRALKAIAVCLSSMLCM